MRRFATTFVRTLAFLTVTSLVGCDEVDDLDIDDIDVDDLELRDDPLPIASIPADDPPGTLSFSIPMQPTGEFKPKPRFSLHGPTSLDYIWTPDPTGAPDTILTDINGVSPYSEDLEPVPESVCSAFLAVHPYYVPIAETVQGCAQIEQGCCDHICYLWGGWAPESNGQNLTTAVDNDTFKKEMVWGTYVDTQRVTWDMELPNGGHSMREAVCGCMCAFEEP